ncbi:MAG TPA: tetratricopeptide repeat protein [Sideroxyarcus sp.]|nr:tetratricopeptide repeat protein [Sideroxyarcus sp.]
MTSTTSLLPRTFLACTLLAACLGMSAASAAEQGAAQQAYEAAGARFEAEDYAGAIALYDQALKTDPGFIAAYSDRGLAKLKIKDFKGAIADYEAILKRKKDADEAYAYRAQAKAGLGDIKGALADFDKAIGLCPTCGYFYLNRGKVHLQAGDKAKAKQDFLEAADLNVEDAQELLNGL